MGSAERLSVILCSRTSNSAHAASQTAQHTARVQQLQSPGYAKRRCKFKQKPSVRERLEFRNLKTQRRGKWPPRRPALSSQRRWVRVCVWSYLFARFYFLSRRLRGATCGFFTRSPTRQPHANARRRCVHSWRMYLPGGVAVRLRAAFDFRRVEARRPLVVAAEASARTPTRRGCP